MMSSSSSSSPPPFAFPDPVPTLPMYDGTLHPSIGYGTYKVGFVPSSVSESSSSSAPVVNAEDCVYDALSVGYRFLECAEFYGNERSVGNAISRFLEDSGNKDNDQNKRRVLRKDLFLCSKVWSSTIEEGPDAVRRQFEKTLDDLQTDYLDMYLIHWPVPRSCHIKAYGVLQDLHREGRIRCIGVSNYSVEDYLELKEHYEGEVATGSGGEFVKPYVNQIEINPFLYRRDTINFFKEEGILLQSYRSLRDGKSMDHPTLQRIGRSHAKTPAQILGRWCVQKDVAYTAKSVRRERMIENADVFNFFLTEDEMDELDSLTNDIALDTFVDLYRKCVNRDTTMDGTMDGVKMAITRG